MPKISIVVPVYNLEKELSRCVESLVAQTYSDIEILLVNDGSTDTSGELCDDWARKDHRIHVIHKENGGLSDARNVGILTVSGEYLLLVDGDDTIDINTCMTIKDHTPTSPDVIVFDYLRIEGGKQERIQRTKSLVTHTHPHDYLIKHYRQGTMTMMSVVNAYRREMIVSNNILFKKGIIHEDEEWTPRVFLAAKSLIEVPFTMYCYWIRSQSISQQAPSKKPNLDIIETCHALEPLYNNQTNPELRKWLMDALLTHYLYAIEAGQLYSKEDQQRIRKSFLKHKAATKRNRLKVALYLTHPKLYRFVYRWVRR